MTRSTPRALEAFDIVNLYHRERCKENTCVLHRLN